MCTAWKASTSSIGNHGSARSRTAHAISSCVDNRAAARLLAEVLIRLGHRRIAVTHRPGGELWTAEERLTGATEHACRAADASRSIHRFIWRTAYRSDAAYAATVSLLTRPDRPTGDPRRQQRHRARRRARAITDLGFHCPTDVSVVGIDDVPWSGLVKPRVTTAAQPIEDISRMAIEWLLERMAG